MTIQTWAEIWFSDYKTTVRRTTAEATRYLIKNHIVPRLGTLEVSKITEEIVKDFLDTCQSEGNHKRNTPLSQYTMRHIQAALSMILNGAVTKGMLKNNPAKPFVYYCSQNVDAEILSEWETELYLEAAEKLGYLPIFIVALECGLRQRELIALKWSDLDIENQFLVVHEERVVEARSLKEYGESIRIIPLSDQAVEQLIIEHQKHPSNPVMFVHPGTLKPYSPAMLRRLHNRVIEVSGLPFVPFKNLRHTCIVHQIQSGKGIEEISPEICKAGAGMTKHRYRNYIQTEAAERLNKIQHQKQEQEEVAELFNALLPI